MSDDGASRRVRRVGQSPDAVNDVSVIVVCRSGGSCGSGGGGGGRRRSSIRGRRFRSRIRFRCCCAVWNGCHYYRRSRHCRWCREIRHLLSSLERKK